jgi:hypothetical protein
MWDTLYKRPCGRIRVTKKDGSEDSREVLRLGAAFMVDGTECCYAYLGERYPVPGQPGSAAHMCDECGERRAVTTARDLSGITGSVCGVCARSGALSFA